MELQVQPSMKTPAIPPEIWMRVAEFVPHVKLRTMFSINHAFFESSMDARYRTLSFSTESDAEELWRLGRARDSSISHRIRCLDIHLDGYKFYKQFNKRGKLNPGWTGISLQEGIQMMTETVPFLPNVTDLSVRWFSSPRDEHLSPFLVVAWKSLASGLRKLSFCVSLEYLPPLLSAADGLISLRDLDVGFSGKKFFETNEPLVTNLAPFINKVAPTLRSLSFDSGLSNMKLTEFFHGLSNIPNLEKLSIVITDDDFHPGNIARFICNHATTLRHLEWDQQCGYSPNRYFMDSLGGNNLDQAFSDLRTLRTRVPQNPGGFAIVMERIMLSANTLTSLGLIEYDMAYEELSSLISLFTPDCGRNLRELSFQVECISSEFIVLLAQRLPRLEALTIHIVHVSVPAEEKANPRSIDKELYESRAQEELSNAEIFTSTMRTYDFRAWSLRDINIDTDYWWDDRLPLKLMSVLAECVPSLQTFCGKEKESYEICHDDQR